MVVTALRVVGSGRDRISVQLDRHPAGQIEATDATALDLTKGTPLNEDQAADLTIAIDRCGALRRALRLLQTRDRSSGEMRDRLRRAGHSTEAAARVVTRLVDSGYIDDKRLAERMAGALADRGTSGRRLIELKLSQKGVDRPTASHAATEATAERDALADATTLAHKRVRQASPRLASDALARRVYAFLARRGFEAQVCERATKSAMAGRTSPSESPDLED
jgi:regulatory protein